MRKVLCCTLLAATLACRTLTAQTRGPILVQLMLLAEDARGHGADGIGPLRAGLVSTDAGIRAIAARGMGRLQRIDLVNDLMPLLADVDANVRAETANALAQAVIRSPRRGVDTIHAPVAAVAGSLRDQLAREKDPAARDAMSDALGRLPYADSALGHGAERAIVSAMPAAGSFGTVRGLYWLALNRGTGGGIVPASGVALRTVVVSGTDPVVRRAAVLALNTARMLDSATTMHALADADEQVRRLALAGLGTLGAARDAALRQAVIDPSMIVRIGAISPARTQCDQLLKLAGDKVDGVALVAIDSLSVSCVGNADADAMLRTTSHAAVTAGPVDHRWQRAAHALVALSMRDSVGDAAMTATYAASPAWGMRLAAANAATATSNIALLRTLAVDRDHNVSEAAIAGLSRRVKHYADSLYIRALASDGHQTVLAAAKALAGAPPAAALPSLYEAMTRLTAQRIENTKDPRVAVMQRIGEMGSAADSARLMPYLADYDSTIATMAARSLAKWTGHAWTAAPRPLPLPPLPLELVANARDIQIVVKMAASSGGGSFTMRLFGAEAPATTARILKLVQSHFYDGHLFQRVEPNFVVQGGGGDASEYAGDAMFMRDELTLRSHLRGTLGISSRGRDTGDAQWFINLVDNTRLDHEYTVAGEIISGREVAEQILEGDRIASVVMSRGPRI